MIGFTQYSPAVLSLLVNRDEFYPLVVHNSSEITCSKIAEFLENPDERIKVVMLAGMDVLVDVLEHFDLHDTKVAVLDTILNLSRADLEIQDAQRRPDRSFQFFPITPTDLNRALQDCEFGIPESGIRTTVSEELLIPRKAQIIRKNTVPGDGDKLELLGELSDMMDSITMEAGLGKREEFLVIEGTMKYIVGIYNKRRFRSMCNTYDLNTDAVGVIANFINDTKGKALRLAFMDVNIYGTDAHEAVVGVKANKLDFDFLISVLPEDRRYEFAIDIPSRLVKRRKNTVSKICTVKKSPVEPSIPKEKTEKAVTPVIKKAEKVEESIIAVPEESMEKFDPVNTPGEIVPEPELEEDLELESIEESEEEVVENSGQLLQAS